MSVTRGTFLKSLGKSLPGMVLGSTAAMTARKFLAKIAAVSGETEISASKSTPAMPNDTKPAPAEFIHSGPAAGNRVALTFDDGPIPGVTDCILDELKQRGLRATFFMIGRCVAAAPDLARRVLAEGHDVANHTFTHPNLTELSDAQVAHEIQQTQDVFADLLSHRPAWFRAPYGLLRKNQAELVHSRGMRVAMWTVDTKDWSEPGEEQILAAVFRDPKPGAIILCHDNHAQTANAVGPMLDGLLQRGFTPVTLSELMAN